MKTQKNHDVIPTGKVQYDSPKIGKLEIKLEYSIAQASVEATMKESKDVESETVDIGW